MNKCFFIGRTTRDAELRYTQGENQMAVANVAIAVDDGFGDSKTTSYFDLVIWGKRAESFQKYVPKGTKVAITSRAKQSKWKDKLGQSRYSISFTVEDWEFAEGKSDKPSGTKAAVEPDGFADVDDSIMEDLPFA